MEQNKYSNLLLQPFATCSNQNINLCTVVHITHAEDWLGFYQESTTVTTWPTEKKEFFHTEKDSLLQEESTLEVSL